MRQCVGGKADFFQGKSSQYQEDLLVPPFPALLPEVLTPVVKWIPVHMQIGHVSKHVLITKQLPLRFCELPLAWISREWYPFISTLRAEWHERNLQKNTDSLVNTSDLWGKLLHNTTYIIRMQLHHNIVSRISQHYFWRMWAVVQDGISCHTLAWQLLFGPSGSSFPLFRKWFYADNLHRDLCRGLWAIEELIRMKYK